MMKITQKLLKDCIADKFSYSMLPESDLRIQNVDFNLSGTSYESRV